MSDKKIGTNIRQVRQLRGFSQEAVAHDLGISQTQYSKIEAGDDIKILRLKAIARILDVEMETILNFNFNFKL